MTLYLKYRPQKIGELDLTSVRESLEKIVKSGNIPHAFLFAGPKGTGKTSAARIMAKVVNCERRSSQTTDYRPRSKKGCRRSAVDRKQLFEPCNKCSQCVSITKGENIDVIELDAASHRGIDDVRTLRDAVKLAPANAKKKVYIIDEAHMLTTEASNALLKTLEEPPEHVMFVLATTNPEKLIETIKSRTVLIRFENATIEEMVRSLKKKVKGEKVKVDEDTLILIAQAADYSFRDADKILEQLITGKKVLKKDKVEQFLFKSTFFNTSRFFDLLLKKDAQKLISLIEKAATAGTSSKRMTEKIIERLRKALLFKVGIEGDDIEQLSKEEVVKLIRLFSNALNEISTAYLEQIPLEIAVVQWCEDGESGSGGAGGTGKSTKSSTGLKGMRDKRAVGGEKKKGDNNDEQVLKRDTKNNGLPEDIWNKILLGVKPKNTSTEALLRAARPVDYDGKTLTLGVFYSFHKEKLEVHPHRDLLESVSTSILGNPVKVTCKLTQPIEKAEKSKKSSGEQDEVVLTEGEDEDIIKIAEKIFSD